jgi:hypothetical protein
MEDGKTHSPYFGIVALKRLSWVRETYLEVSRETFNACAGTVVKQIFQRMMTLSERDTPATLPGLIKAINFREFHGVYCFDTMPSFCQWSLVSSITKVTKACGSIQTVRRLRVCQCLFSMV